jgi:hypothetical protein
VLGLADCACRGQEGAPLLLLLLKALLTLLLLLLLLVVVVVEGPWWAAPWLLLLLLTFGLLAVLAVPWRLLRLLLEVHGQNISLLLLLLLPLLLLLVVVVQVDRSRNCSLAAAAPAEHTWCMLCRRAWGPGSTDPVSCHKTSSRSDAASGGPVDVVRPLFQPARQRG